jgi:hypothetical protein
MSNLINSIERESFTLFISSNDKISGTNNNGQYLVNWDDFLPRGYNFFKMLFNFQTSGGYYKDFSGNAFAAAKIVFNTGGKSHSFDTKTSSQSNTLGYVQRDIQTTASTANTLSCCYLFNAPKTISRPNQNVITITVYNTCTTTQASGLLVDTNSAGSALAADMSNWQMILEFIPIGDSIQPNHVNF